MLNWLLLIRKCDSESEGIRWRRDCGSEAPSVALTHRQFHLSTRGLRLWDHTTSVEFRLLISIQPLCKVKPAQTRFSLGLNVFMNGTPRNPKPCDRNSRWGLHPRKENSVIIWAGYIYFFFSESFTVQNRPPSNKIATTILKTTMCNTEAFDGNIHELKNKDNNFPNWVKYSIAINGFYCNVWHLQCCGTWCRFYVCWCAAWRRSCCDYGGLRSKCMRRVPHLQAHWKWLEMLLRIP